MKLANEVTLAAYEAAYRSTKEGMTQNDFGEMVQAAYAQQGFQGDASIQIRREFRSTSCSAKSQVIREGAILLMDGGCKVEGYEADISRTVVLGKPTDKRNKCLIPSAGSGENDARPLSKVASCRRFPERKRQMPIYALKHARSRSEQRNSVDASQCGFNLAPPGRLRLSRNSDRFSCVCAGRRPWMTDEKNKQLSSGVIVIAQLRGIDPEPELNAGDVIRSVNAILITCHAPA